jgi:hypothetical protein
MKRSLLTLGVIAGVAGFAAGASAQGYIFFGNAPSTDFNTVSSTGSAGAYSGNVTLQLYYIAAAGNFATVQNIDTLAASASTEATAIADIKADFTQASFGTAANPSATSVLFNISGGTINSTPFNGGAGQGDYFVSGASGNVFYALIATTAQGQSLSGGLVLDAPGAAGYSVGSAPPGTPNLLSSDWGNSQNLLLAGAVPEPTTIALAGLGGLSMLFLRRRKA